MRTWMVVGALAVLALRLPVARAQDFNGCGVLTQGIECVLFQPDTGGLYVLDNYGGFHVGDRVLVRGQLDPGCFTFCAQGNGCIDQNTIARCACPGDMNCDGLIDFGDIDPFVAILGGAVPCNADNADVNGDGVIDFADIDPFVALLASGATCP